MTVELDVFNKESGKLKGNFVNTENHSIYYEEASNSSETKQTIIVSHGACATGRYMNLIALALLDSIPNTKVIVLDLPFHGESTTSLSLEGVTVHDYTAYTEEFLHKLKGNGVLEGAVTWLGWSMGGSIGLLLTKEDTLLDNLVLVNSSSCWESVEGLVTLFTDNSSNKEVFKHIVLESLQGESQELISKISTSYDEITSSGEVIQADFNAILPKHYDLRETLQGVETPTLIFSGTSDNVAELGYQHHLADNIPNSEIVLVEDNHCTVLHPDKVVTLVSAVKNFIY